MKKRLFVIVVLVVVTLMGLVGCNSNGHASLDVFARTDAFRTTQQTDEITFANSVNVDGKYYVYYFYLGTIQDVPVYSSYTLQYSVDEEVAFMFSESSREELTKSVSRSSETVDMHSYEGGFDVKIGGEISSEVNLLVKNVKRSISVSAETDHRWTSNWGTIVNDTETTIEYYLKETTSSLASKVVFSEENGFKKGNYYRKTFFETVDAYGVLVYDIENDTYSADDDFLFKNSGRMLRWEESADGNFEYQPTKNLLFDLDAAIEYAKNHKPTEKLATTSTVEPLTLVDGAVRTGYVKINGSSAYNDSSINLGKTTKELREMGYTKLDISISYDIKEVDNCQQRVFLYTADGYEIYRETIEHGGSKQLQKWGTHYITKQADLSKFDSNQLYFRCQAENKIFKDFYLGTVRVKIVAMA